jgi:endonuclease YncB( thermonuclease family)
MVAAAAGPAIAAGCALAPQGQGRVVEVIDARTFRLEDGRDIRLAGIEPVVTGDTKTSPGAALSAIIAGHVVILRGDDDTPDRYGRQPALVFLGTSDTPVQSLLLAHGDALVAATVTDRDYASILSGAEAEARQAKRGIWPIPWP